MNNVEIGKRRKQRRLGIRLHSIVYLRQNRNINRKFECWSVEKVLLQPSLLLCVNFLSIRMCVDCILFGDS